MISYGFEKLYFERIYGHCMSRNSASRKVMEKIGFKFEGTLRHGIKKGEVFEDLDLLGMIRSDYEKILLHPTHQKYRRRFKEGRNNNDKSSYI